jgi:hypothetical protein
MLIQIEHVNQTERPVLGTPIATCLPYQPAIADSHGLFG